MTIALQRALCDSFVLPENRVTPTLKTLPHSGAACWPELPCQNRNTRAMPFSRSGGHRLRDGPNGQLPLPPRPSPSENVMVQYSRGERQPTTALPAIQDGQCWFPLRDSEAENGKGLAPEASPL